MRRQGMTMLTAVQVTKDSTDSAYRCLTAATDSTAISRRRVSGQETHAASLLYGTVFGRPGIRTYCYTTQGTLHTAPTF